MPKAIPEGYHSVTPTLTFKDARKAIDFYKKALGAVERYAMPGPDGKGVMHAEIQIGDSIFMVMDENPQMQNKSAESLGGSPVSFYIYLDNVDEAFKRATAAGAQTKMAVDDMFWGDRVGTVHDQFGYCWSLATHVKDLSPKEVEEGAKAAFGKKAA
jgi:PhnB protein